MGPPCAHRLRMMQKDVLSVHSSTAKTKRLRKLGNALLEARLVGAAELEQLVRLLIGALAAVGHLDKDKRRHRAHAKLLGNRAVVVDVDLEEGDVGVVLGELRKRGADALARAAPRRG